MSAKPHHVINAEKMKEINHPIDLHTDFDMMKFLDTYKRSVDYYNSYGLDQPRTRTQETRQNTQRPSTVSSFWDLN